MGTASLLLEVNQLYTECRNSGIFHPALEEISFSVGQSEIVGLVGESGSGKSSLAMAVLRLSNGRNIRISGGQVLWKGEDLLSLSEKELQKKRGKEIAVLFQEPSAYSNPVIRIGDQLKEHYFRHFPGHSESQAKNQILSLFSKLGLPEPESRLKQYPFECSGGQLQRILLAQSLLTRPELLIADEPTTALDVATQNQLVGLLSGLREKEHLSILLISHNLELVSRISDRMMIMYCGRIVEQGAVREILSNPSHPYTQLLLKSGEIPEKWDPLETLPGSVPDFMEKPRGCAFHPRCPRARPVCSEQVPPLETLASGHFCLCHFAGESSC